MLCVAVPYRIIVLYGEVQLLLYTQHPRSPNQRSSCFSSQIIDYDRILRVCRTSSLTQLDLTDSSGRTALHLASQDGQIEALAELLERSVEVDARDGQENTGLHIAAYSGKVCTHQTDDRSDPYCRV